MFCRETKAECFMDLVKERSGLVAVFFFLCNDLLSADFMQGQLYYSGAVDD